VGRSLSPGAAVRLSFRLPGRELRIEVTGVVARVDDKQRAGIRFAHIGARELHDLIGSEEDESTHTAMTAAPDQE